MKCAIVDIRGHKFFVCGLARRKISEQKCRCGQIATLVCDFPVRGVRSSRRCDRAMCETCTTKIGDLDLCPPHAQVWKGER